MLAAMLCCAVLACVARIRLHAGAPPVLRMHFTGRRAQSSPLRCPLVPCRRSVLSRFLSRRCVPPGREVWGWMRAYELLFRRVLEGNTCSHALKTTVDVESTLLALCVACLLTCVRPPLPAGADQVHGHVWIRHPASPGQRHRTRCQGGGLIKGLHGMSKPCHQTW